MEKKDIIYGINSVIEHIKSKKSLNKVYIAKEKRDKRVKEIIKLCKSYGIPYQFVEKRKILSLAEGKGSQGVIGVMTPFSYISLKELLEEKSKEKKSFILVLDKIEDPGNLGALIRTAACADISGIVIERYKSAPITSTVIKVSEGGINYVKIARAGSILNTIKILKDCGYTVIGTKVDGDVLYFEQKYPDKTALILGNEGKGLGQKTIEKCDYTVRIPISQKMESLNVSSSGAILMYEWVRQVYLDLGYDPKMRKNVVRSSKE